MDPYRVSGEFDILGDDDDEMLLGELGADEYDILGAARRARRGGGRAKSGVVVRRQQPSQVRRLGLPLDSGSTAVAAGASATITVQPNVTIRPERLKVADECANAFRISSVAIGRKLQFAAGGSIAASLYRASNPNNEVQWDTADKREPIEITIVNESAAAARFMGELVGTVIE